MLRLKTGTNLIWILLAIFSVATGPAIALASTSTATTQGAASMFIIGPDGITKSMELKATKETSGAQPVKGFKLGVENVVAIPLNGIASVFGDVSVQFSGAKLTPSSATIGSDQTIDIPVANGKIDFAGIAAGIYTLDVIVADKFAYECLLVIGQDTAQARQVVTKEIIEINTNSHSDVKIFEKGKQKHNGKPKPEPSICYFKPNDDPSCKPVNGKCPDGFSMNSAGNCHPSGKCPKGFEQVDDDETGTCYSKKNTFHCPTSGAIVLRKSDCAIYEPDLTPTPTPAPLKEPEKCVEGSTPEPISGKCVVSEPITPSPEPTPTPKTLTEEPEEEPKDRFCGTDEDGNGVPCTSSEKEGGTASDIVKEDEIQSEEEPQTEEEPEEEKDDVVTEDKASEESDKDSGESEGN